MKSKILLFVGLSSAAHLHAAYNIVADPGFGGGDGWRAPGEVITGDTPGTATAGVFNYLGTGGLERGLDYNPVTKNLVLVSRSTAGNGIRILNSTTGADAGFLNQGSGIIAGGTFTTNMVGVASDGAIYVGNLNTAAAGNFRVYQWASEAATAPTVAYSAVIGGITRTGDSFAVTGSGTGTVIAASGITTTLNGNFAALKTTNGTTFTSTAYTGIVGTTAASNDYRLGLTFVDSDTLIGSQGVNARITDFAGSATLNGSIPLGTLGRAMDYVMFNGLPTLAVIDSATSLVSIYDITTPATPLLLTSAAFTTTSGTLAGNPNGTGSLAWGAVTATTAELFAMSTNQGIQKFLITVPAIPEPGTTGLAGLALLLGAFRRRR